MLAAMLATLAIVTTDHVALRAAPRDSAQQQALLWQGDSLEIRGEKLGFLQVYDHRHERAGYVRAAEVRTTSLKPEEAPALLAVVNFLRDTPGEEALGLAYAAAYIKAAPAPDIGPDIFDAMGTMADRLAVSASARHSQKDDAVVAAHVEVARSMGIGFTNIEHGDRVRLCYDGEALRRVLALPAAPEARARAALALTRPECVDPDLPPLARLSLDGWRADVLDRVDVSQLPAWEKNRIRLRQAGVLSSLAFEQAQAGGKDAATSAGQALTALAAIDSSELAEEDQADYREAAIRVGASRLAADSAAAAQPAKMALAITPGLPGQTCITVTPRQPATAKPDSPAPAPLLKQCTYSRVWPASATWNRQETALTLAVQPLATWRELWLVHQTAKGWVVDVLPPASDGPDLGYIEAAGWTPDGSQLLVVREARVGGRFLRKFGVLRVDSLATVREADRPAALSAFYRWQSPAWKERTVSLR